MTRRKKIKSTLLNSTPKNGRSSVLLMLLTTHFSLSDYYCFARVIESSLVMVWDHQGSFTFTVLLTVLLQYLFTVSLQFYSQFLYKFDSLMFCLIWWKGFKLHTFLWQLVLFSTYYFSPLQSMKLQYLGGEL